MPWGLVGKEMGIIKVAVSGGFDPIHSGHIDHIKKAKQLGDYLIAIVQSDENLIRKKGYAFMPYSERASIVGALKYVDEVAKNIDGDGTSARTLERVKPDIFAKGGDRSPNNMPKNEIEICGRIGCKIIYGTGDQLNSSSDIVETAWDKIRGLKT